MAVFIPTDANPLAMAEPITPAPPVITQTLLFKFLKFIFHI